LAIRRHRQFRTPGRLPVGPARREQVANLRYGFWNWLANLADVNFHFVEQLSLKKIMSNFVPGGE
jgi:hypothetical protein